jgi:glycosyltransferase involved in cell wall biosynthesis
MQSEAGFLADRGAFLSVPVLPRTVLAALYRRATLLLQTSEAEGFGLPVAEAMACGLTVVASDIAVLREVGGSAAHYCPPGNEAAWTGTVERLIHERRNLLPGLIAQRHQTNLSQASRFSLERHLTGTVRVYEEVTGSTWHPLSADMQGEGVPMAI